jgi:hypothetical protein
MKILFISILLLLSSCIDQDPSRARITLSMNGYTVISTDVQDKNRIEIKQNFSNTTISYPVGDQWRCPHHWDTCTDFRAIAPWGWPVSGVVSCPKTGICDIHVVFRNE